jgi:hypothetical protein
MIVPVLGLAFVAFNFSPDQVLHLSLGTSLAAMIIATASGDPRPSPAGRRALGPGEASSLPASSSPGSPPA